MVSKEESSRIFKRNGVILTNYRMNGRDYQLEEICISPTGERYLKHDFVTEHFKHSCRNCGAQHGVKNTEEEMRNYKVNTIFQR